MAKWRVLVTAPRARPEINRYKKELGFAGCEVSAAFPEEHLKEEELVSLVGDIDGIICGDDHITVRVLDAAPGLKVISKWGIGIDSIDVTEAEHRGILVYNTPGTLNDPVADTVLGYVLLFARKPDQMASDMKAGLWKRRQVSALRECTLGIVGLGNIGCAVASRAAVFGMNILGHTLDNSYKENLSELNIKIVSLNELLTISDFVTLHIDMRAGNRHLIDEKGLKRMKPTSVIINTARGALIDEDALVTALQRGWIAGAALDVFEKEPLDMGSPLLNIENVYLAPHNANSSNLAAQEIHKLSIQNLLKGLEIGSHR